MLNKLRDCTEENKQEGKEKKERNQKRDEVHKATQLRVPPILKLQRANRAGYLNTLNITAGTYKGHYLRGRISYAASLFSLLRIIETGQGCADPVSSMARASRPELMTAASPVGYPQPKLSCLDVSLKKTREQGPVLFSCFPV